MSERKHTPTPGPWRVNKYGSIGAGERGTEPIVAMVEPFYSVDKRHGDHAANARLIAAAPDMAKALEKIIDALNTDTRQKSIIGDEVEYHLDGGTMSLAINSARAALAKARGLA